MSNNTTNKKIKATDLYVFDLAYRFALTGLTTDKTSEPATSGTHSPVPLTAANLEKNDKGTLAEAATGPACNYCGAIPQDDTDADYIRNHYRRDYHRYNIKRSFHHQAPLTEAEFDALVGELDESISGSESESEGSQSSGDEGDNKIEALMRKTNLLEAIPEDEREQGGSAVTTQEHNSPYFLFTSPQLSDDKVFAVYKSVFDQKFTTQKGVDEPQLSAQERVDGAIQALDAQAASAIFMIGGGHFSGAIISHQRLKQVPTANNPYADVEVVAHKSFHRYTTRRKQGGAQSASDNARGKANSAGSSLRRYNEAALEKEIRELLVEWAKPYLSKVSAIYVRANGRSNRGILMNFAGSPIVASDPRVKSLPFTTRRATATEVKRAWWELSHAKIIDKPQPKTSEAKPEQKTTTKQQPQSQPESPNDVHTRELTALIRRSKIPSLVAYLRKNKLDASAFRLTPAEQLEHLTAPTLLHYAAARGAAPVVTTLLKQLKADPTVRNSAGKTAYQTAADRATCDAFQIVRAGAGEQRQPWGDWDADARVGPGLTREQVRERDAREKQSESEANRSLLLDAQRKEVEKIKAKEAKEAAIRAAHSHVLGTSSTRLSGASATSSLTELSASNATLLELTPEERRKFEREQRARAIEARMAAKK